MHFTQNLSLQRRCVLWGKAGVAIAVDRDYGAQTQPAELGMIRYIVALR